MATSRYYYESLPPWVQAWNDRKQFLKYREKGWQLSRPLDSYVNRSGAQNPYAHPKSDTGPKFPHTLNAGGDAALVAGIRFTPFLDELTADFARELISQEKLGANGVTDYLSISFSSTDYVGHSYGPNSIESEDNLIHLDATLTKLFAFIDKTVGLKNTVIVLSADHGVDDIPEERKQLGYDAERFGGEKLRADLNAALRKKLNVGIDLVAAVIPPGIYLDQAKVRESKLDAFMVENALATIVRADPGVAYVFTRTDLLTGKLLNTPLMASVQPCVPSEAVGGRGRRAEAVLLLRRNAGLLRRHAWLAVQLRHVCSGRCACAGRGAEDVRSKPVAPGQIAPTLAALLGIKAPSGCSCGPPLPYVVPR